MTPRGQHPNFESGPAWIREGGSSEVYPPPRNVKWYKSLQSFWLNSDGGNLIDVTSTDLDSIVYLNFRNNVNGGSLSYVNFDDLGTTFRSKFGQTAMEVT